MEIITLEVHNLNKVCKFFKFRKKNICTKITCIKILKNIAIISYFLRLIYVLQKTLVQENKGLIRNKISLGWCGSVD